MVNQGQEVSRVAQCRSELLRVARKKTGDRQTDRPTKGRTDTPSYRDARTHLKMGVQTKKIIFKMKNFNFWLVTFENCSWPMKKKHEHLTRVHSTYPQSIWSLLQPVKVVLFHYKYHTSLPKYEIFVFFATKTLLILYVESQKLVCKWIGLYLVCM